MNEKSNKDRGFAIIGKVVVVIIVIAILLPFALNKWFTVNVVSSPPEGKVFKIEVDNGSAIVTRKMVCVFSDGLMHLYTYDETPFGEMGGIRIDYKYAWSSYHPLLGGLYVTSTPSILPWENYELLDSKTLDKASVIIKQSGINTLNYDEANGLLDDSKQTVIITVKTDSIILDGMEFPLISEEDATDYEILRFDRESKPFNKT